MQSLHSTRSVIAKKVQRHHPKNGLVIGLAVAGCIAILITLLIACYFLYNKLKTRRTSPYEVTSLKLQRFSYRKLKAATNGFSHANKLGQGGFGAVYKGILKNGQEIAVKKLDTASLQGEREFQNEVMIIGNISSSLIVNLIGFCVDNKKRLLVYEYMHNGSLQEALFDEDNPFTLDWKTRFKIIQDVSNSLAFLQLNCEPPIIHGDVKPSNILLDASYSARIADFGIARHKVEVSGSEVRSEDMGACLVEQERIRQYRMARDKERKLRRKEERNRKDDSNEVKAIEKDIPRLVPSPAANKSPVMNRSPLSYHQIMLNPIKQRKAGVILTRDDEREDPTDNKDGPLAIDASVDIPDTEFLGASPKVSLMDEISPKGKILSEETLVSPSGSGSNSSETRESKEEGIHISNWWWHQDAEERNGDGSAPNLGCEIRRGETSHIQWDLRDEGQSGVKHTSKDKKEGWGARSMSLEWWGQCISSKDIQEIRKNTYNDRQWKKEDFAAEKCQEKSKKPKEADVNKENRRPIREWWREEYSEELNRKNAKKLDGKSSRDTHLNGMSRDLSFDLSGELHPQGGGVPSSKGKEWWSGDLLKWNRHRDTTGIESSGEISIARQQEGRRDQSHGRELWSGDTSGRPLSSTSSMRGTVCYVAPEYGGGGILTEKSDIYSYGVLILVIVSGRRPLQVAATPAEFDRANLISWARNLAQTGNILDLVDAAMQGVYSKEQALLCITLALLCLQRLPAVRPTIEDVVKVLSGEIQLPALPLEFSPSPSYDHSALRSNSTQQPATEEVIVELPLLS